MPYINNIVSSSSPYFVLLCYIPEGKENAVSMKILAYALNIKERGVRALVLNARKDGFIIGSDDCGYYIPESREELEEYYSRIQFRQKTTEHSLVAVRKKLEEESEE